MAKILVVDDDVAFCKMLETFLKKKGYGVSSAFSAETALAEIDKTKFDLVLSDVRLPNKDGNEILKSVKEKGLQTQVVLMTGYAEVSLAVDAMKKGAYDYISKPVNPDKLLEIVQKALNRPPEEKPVEKSTPVPEVQPRPTKIVRKSEHFGTPEFITGVGQASKKLEQYISLVAPTSMSVLIVGDSGTGKEYIAKQIHDKSGRNSGPFVAVDCGAIPQELATSEFFGHIKGSFTGALNDKTGHFEAASGGTLFLDEVGNLSYELQMQLLRALQERKIKPVGSNKEIEVDIRVIAATNENLEKALDENNFREDLFHRLNEFSIKVPTLKERREDLLLFADHFLTKANAELGKDVVDFSEEVIKIFENYSWPGNLRELQNYIKRAVLFTSGKTIQKEALPDKLLYPQEDIEDEGLFKNKSERQMILDALESTDGNKSKAARILKIDRKTLYNKLKAYNIKL